MLFNPVTLPTMTNYQLVSEKAQNKGYLGIGAEGEVLVPGTFKATGKVGFNGAAEQGKVADMGSSSTGISISLLEAITINTPLNDHAKKLNEVRTCLRNVGLMA